MGLPDGALTPVVARPGSGHARRKWFMKTFKENTFAVGKYLVSPLVTRTESGRFAASVSIRSGQGSATHHRVLRFVPRFDTRDIAQRYALDHGMAWLQRASHTS